MAQYDVDLRDYWRVLKKRKTAIILFAVLAGVSSFGFAKLKEPIPIYETSATVKISRSMNVVGLLTGSYWFAAEDNETQKRMITSFPVLEMTVKALGWIPQDISSEVIKGTPEYTSKLSRASSMIQAEVEEGTNIINIRVESEDPALAAEVANQTAQSFRQYNILEKNKQTYETKQFVEEQLRRTSENLREAELALKSFKENNKLLIINQQASSTLNEIDKLESNLNQVTEKKGQIAGQLQRLESSTQNYEDLEGVNFPENRQDIFAALSAQYHAYLLERKVLLHQYTRQHPKVTLAEEKIRGVIESMKQELRTLLGILSSRERDILQALTALGEQRASLPDKALTLARLERELALQETLFSELKTKYQETLIQESGKVEEVSIISPAIVPTIPTNIPSKLLVVITGVIMGFVIGVIYTFIAETLDTSIGTIEDVESTLEVPVLGVIPSMSRELKDRAAKGVQLPEKAWGKNLIAHYDPKSLSSEAFRTLRSNVQFTSIDKNQKTFIATSSFIQEGKTFNIVNLALSMAQSGEKVLLVEADLRRPVIHKMFGLNRSPGVTDCVLGNYAWRDIRNNITDVMLGEFELDDILKTPGLENLHIITAGTSPPNPAEILRSSRFREFIKEVKQEYDFVFFDVPPVLPVADATEVAPLVDGVILVYMVGKIGRGVLKRVKLSLDNINAKVMGVVLNNVRPESGPDYFQYHTQYYYEEDDKRKTKGRPFNLSGSPGASLRPSIQALSFVALLLLLTIGIFWPSILIHLQRF